MKKALIFIVLLNSCLSNRLPKISSDFQSMLDSKIENNNTSGVLLNGFYMISGYKNPNFKNIYAGNAWFFYGNGLIYNKGGLYNDSTEFSTVIKNYSNDKRGRVNWGAYNIIGDSVKAIILCEFRRHNEQLFKYFQCYYSGKIGKDGKIYGWKMDKPYPNISTEFNGNAIEQESNPKDLEFKLFPAKVLVDSNKVWINDYKSKK